MTTEFLVRLERFLRGAQAAVDRDRNARFPTLPPLVLVPDPPGRRFIRIVAQRGDEDRHVWAFIDVTNGDVLKAESWRKPAKHARGNLFDPTGGLGRVNAYGPAYLR